MLVYKREYVYKVLPLKCLVQYNVMYRIAGTFIIILSAICSCNGQNLEYKVVAYEYSDGQDTVVSKWGSSDSVGVIEKTALWLAKAHKRGYLLASTDRILFEGESANIYLYRGSDYSLGNFSLSRIDIPLPAEIEKHIRSTQGMPLSQKDLALFEKKVLEYYSSHGYPFAQVKMDSTSVFEGLINLRLAFTAGPLIKFDTVIVVGDNGFKQSYLQNHLNIHSGKVYDQKKVNNSFGLLSALPGVKVEKKPEVLFKNNKAYVIFKIKRRSVNSLDGIIGLLPNEGGSNRVLITGEFNIDLKNLFRTGKEFNVEWRRLQPLSQQLAVNYKHPYIFNSYLSPGVGLKLLKQDSTFINISRGLSFKFNLGARASANVGTTLYTTRLISTQQYSASLPPAFLDSDFLSYTLGVQLSNTDDIFFPRKGGIIGADMEIGNKNIVRNAGLAESTYDGLPEKSFQLRMHLLGKYYQRLGKQTQLYLKSESGFVQSQIIRLNDLFRVGGFNSLRGFNEYNFYAQKYSLLTTEFRVFTDESSYVYLFYDQSLIAYDIENSSFLDFPLGFGAGVSFSTGRGVFNFAYSLGYSSDQPLALNLSKVHFGLVSKF